MPKAKKEVAKKEEPKMVAPKKSKYKTELVIVDGEEKIKATFPNGDVKLFGL